MACHIVTFPPGTITILSGFISTFLLKRISLATASLNSKRPFAGVYPCFPSLRAFIEASTICSGVRKSGCPMPKLIISLPCCFNFSAFANIIKAFSVPN